MYIYMSLFLFNYFNCNFHISVLSCCCLVDHEVLSGAKYFPLEGCRGNPSRLTKLPLNLHSDKQIKLLIIDQ